MHPDIVTEKSADRMASANVLALEDRVREVEKELEASRARIGELEGKLEDAERRAAGSSTSGSKLEPRAIEARGGQVHTPRPPLPHGLNLPQGAQLQRAVCSRLIRHAVPTVRSCVCGLRGHSFARAH